MDNTRNPNQVVVETNACWNLLLAVTKPLSAFLSFHTMRVSRTTSLGGSIQYSSDSSRGVCMNAVEKSPGITFQRIRDATANSRRIAPQPGVPQNASSDHLCVVLSHNVSAAHPSSLFPMTPSSTPNTHSVRNLIAATFLCDIQLMHLFSPPSRSPP